VWDDWESGGGGAVAPAAAPGAAPLRARFSDGTDCGGARRVAHVTFACSGPSGLRAVKGIAEPRTCEYEMTLACPEACDADARDAAPRAPGTPLFDTDDGAALADASGASTTPSVTPSAAPPAAQSAGAGTASLADAAAGGGGSGAAVAAAAPLGGALPASDADHAALVDALRAELRALNETLVNVNSTLTTVRAALELECPRAAANAPLLLAPAAGAAPDAALPGAAAAGALALTADAGALANAPADAPAEASHTPTPRDRKRRIV
jgi:hypothetical protein